MSYLARVGWFVWTTDFVQCEQISKAIAFSSWTNIIINEIFTNNVCYQKLLLLIFHLKPYLTSKIGSACRRWRAMFQKPARDEIEVLLKRNDNTRIHETFLQKVVSLRNKERAICFSLKSTSTIRRPILKFPNYPFKSKRFES